MQVDRTPTRKSPDVNDNIYDLVLVASESREVTFNAETNTRQVWEYAIKGTDPKEAGTFLFFTGVSRGDKLIEVLTAHGVDTKDGAVTDFDEQTLVGSCVKGLVQRKPGKNGKVYSKIVSLLAKAA